MILSILQPKPPHTPYRCICLCNTMQHNATLYLQQSATLCNTLSATPYQRVCLCNTLQLYFCKTHRNTLQHTATHSVPPHISASISATHCNTLQHTATHCNTLQHTATHCNTLQHTRCHPISVRLSQQHTATLSLQHAATHCNTLLATPHQHVCLCHTPQHTATHCNTRIASPYQRVHQRANTSV